jgi:parvulin-like peptidyl-prolyl isomerase
MARQKQSLRPTKKHLARAERERILRNRIVAGTLIAAILVFGLVGYGIFHETVIVPGEPIAVVDGEEITTRDFQDRVVSYVLSTGQPAAQVALSVLDSMIENMLVRHEAKKMGIEVSEAELDQRIEESLGYYRNGTPTRLPSATPDPTRNAQATLTATASTATPMLEATATAANSPTPRPTPTEYTAEGYQQVYKDFIAGIEEQSGMSEKQVRRIIKTNLLAEKIRADLEQNVPLEGEKTHLRHILTDTEETAQEVRTKLEEGEDWDDLVVEYSQDATTNDAGGELGWLTGTIIIAGFGPSAQLLTTEPVGTLVGPIQTTQGWHVFEILDREVQPLSEYEYQQAVYSAYDDWLLAVRSSADISIAEDWQERIPDVELPESNVYY